MIRIIFIGVFIVLTNWENHQAASAKGVATFLEDEETSSPELFPKKDILEAIKNNQNPEYIEDKILEFEKNLRNIGKDKDPTKVWLALWAIWYQHLHIQNSLVLRVTLDENEDISEYKSDAKLVLKQTSLLSAWNVLDELGQTFQFSTWYPNLFPTWLPNKRFLNFSARKASNIPLAPFQLAEKMGISARYFFPYTLIYYLAEDAWKDYWYPDRRTSLDLMAGEIQDSIQVNIEHGVSEAIFYKEEISKKKWAKLVFLGSEWGSLSWLANNQLFGKSFNEIYDNLDKLPRDGKFNELNLRNLVKELSHHLRKNSNNNSIYLLPVLTYFEESLVFKADLLQ